MGTSCEPGTLLSTEDTTLNKIKNFSLNSVRNLYAISYSTTKILFIIIFHYTIKVSNLTHSLPFYTSQSLLCIICLNLFFLRYIQQSYLNSSYASKPKLTLKYAFGFHSMKAKLKKKKKVVIFL